MNIYLITPTEYPDYDEYLGFVVYAKTEESALNLVIEYTKRSYDSRSQTWETPKLLGKASKIVKEESVILDSFRAG